MYLNPSFREERPDVLLRLMRAHPLATLVTTVDSRIEINHVPLLVVEEAGGAVLTGHLPRANPLWQSFDGSNEAVAVFHGPQSYVTPGWYASKQDHGKVVPTWNYAVVHARGRPRVIDDHEWLLEHLNALTNEHEARQDSPWQIADAPEAFTARMIESLVGVRMQIDSIVGKWKVSQNRPVGDRLGVAAGLRARGDDASIAMEGLVMEHVGDSQDRD